MLNKYLKQILKLIENCKTILNLFKKYVLETGMWIIVYFGL